MTPAMQIFRRALLLPIKDAKDRDRRLMESTHQVNSADQTMTHARSRLARTAERLRLLTEEVLEINEEAKDQ